MPTKSSQTSRNLKTNLKLSKKHPEIKKIKRNNSVPVFEKTTQKTREWIKDIQKEILYLKANDAYHLLRAVLHALRDQLNVNEGAHFSAQLPLLLKGVYYECWNPKFGVRKAASKNDFLNAVMVELGPMFQLKVDLQEAVASIFRVIMKHISPGEMEDVIHSLSPSLRDFLIRTQEPELMN